MDYGDFTHRNPPLPPCVDLCFCLIETESLRHVWKWALNRSGIIEWMELTNCPGVLPVQRDREGDTPDLFLHWTNEWGTGQQSSINMWHLHLEVMVKSSACLWEWPSAGCAPDNHTFPVIVSVTVQGFIRTWIALSQTAAALSVADI